jgi:hypothetical protein
MGHRSRAAMLLTACFVLLLALNAQATVYRCGNTYQDAPCAGGRLVQAEDPRTPQQQLETARAVEKDAAMADALQAQRAQQEAQWAKQRQAAEKVRLAEEAQAAKEAKAQAVQAAKAEAERQKALKPHKIPTRKTPIPKASAAQAP